jgi:hypothetical protein
MGASIMKKLLWALTLLLSVGGARADEGRIPIYQPTTITAPGSYVVTNDFSATSGAAIFVDADNVTIDLAGHTVSGNVDVSSGIGERRLTIQNGRLVGYLKNGAIPLQPNTGGPDMVVTLANIRGLTSGIVFFACSGLSIKDSHIEGPINLSGNNIALRVLIRDSRFDAAVSLWDLHHSGISNSTFTSLQVCAGGQWGAKANRIESNTIAGALTLPYCGGGDLGGLVVANNAASSIAVSSDGNDLARNSVRGGGITVSGSSNSIDDNSTEGSGFGLVISGGNNIFRHNILRNSSGSVQDNGTGNVDAGGNVN